MTSSKWSVIGKRVLIGAVVVALLVPAAFVVWSTLLAEDGDRPPIIVSNGSVHVELARHGGDTNADKDKGKLKTDGDLKSWYHDYTRGRVPGKMDVLVTGVATGGSCDSPSFMAQKVQTATITFTYGTGQSDSGTLTFQLETHGLFKRRVKFTSTALDGKSDGDTKVDFGIPKNDPNHASQAAKMTEVKLEFKNGQGNDNEATCNFVADGQPLVAILQPR